MQLKHLRTFIAVASTLSLTRAGEKLNLAQSSVTEQIQTLELDLGAPLFDRSRRRLALTAAGLRLLDYASSILALSDEARAAVLDQTGKVVGRIAIGAIDSLCLERLPALLRDYCTAFPDVQVALRPGKTVELHGNLKAGLLDVYFTFGDAVDEPGLRSEKLGKEPIVLIGPPNHRLAGRSHIAVEELAQEPFLVTMPGCPMRDALDRAFATKRANRVRVVGEFTSIAAMRSLVEMGAGCALVPRAAVEDALANGRVVSLSWDGTQDTPVAMTWRKQRVLPKALCQFLDTARLKLAA
jgi:DNA-binding transcriptional LysR family regulator